jgi:hypothetical protein
MFIYAKYDFILVVSAMRGTQEMEKGQDETTLKESNKPSILSVLKLALKNINTFRAIKARGKARTPIFLANLEIGKLDINNPIYSQRIEEYNQAVIEYHKGKFLSTEASRKRDKKLWKKAFQSFRKGTQIGDKLYKALKQGTSKSIHNERMTITNNGTEIKFADGVPLVPEVTPVIVLQGSDYEMGYQYAQQLVQVFGSWILENKTGRSFSEKQKKHMSLWEDEHRKHIPWLIEFIQGWVQGANDNGVPMSYEDVLYLWVGDMAPSKDFISQEGLPEIPPMACSGMAAWGSATPDGKLVTGSTGDHELSYQVIIVAYPDDGNAFIYSAFGATGAIAGGGDFWFFGHPAMNSKGLAYVHHGGGPKFLEPKRYWGYGVRRAASVMHIMRYADSAKTALDMEMAMPIGDIGKGDQATVGGFYADDNYGYVIEGRKEPIAIREAGLMGETDFLYANNSAIHPDAVESEWMSSKKDQWTWDPHGGWRPKEAVGMTKSIGLFFQWASGRLSTSDMMIRGMMMSYTNSCERNNYVFTMLDRAKGKIDTEYLKMMYRNGGRLPVGSWDKIVKDYKKTGDWGEISTGHASNALTAVMKPSEGLFYLCTGPAKRGLTPLLPGGIVPIYNETNAFWEIKLSSSPADVAAYAKQRAQEYIDEASSEFTKLETSDAAYEPLKRLLNIARSELEEGKAHEESAKKADGNESPYNWAKATRSYTRAQVRAKQAYNALVPPPDKPEDLRFS